jgi:hypothetical protein
MKTEFQANQALAANSKTNCPIAQAYARKQGALQAKEAFKDGYNAYKCQVWRSHNPYPYGSQAEKDWDDGWLEAELGDY